MGGMGEWSRLRWAHLSSQVLAVAGVAIVLSASGDTLSEWGISSKRYGSEFHAHLADLELGRTGGPEALREKVEFLKRHAPRQLDLDGKLRRLGILVAVMLILPVGMGAYAHRACARVADAGEAPVEAESLRVLARVEAALAAIAVAVVLVGIVGGGMGSADAAKQVGWIPGSDDSKVEGLTQEAYLAVRGSHRSTRTGVTIAFAAVGMTFLLGVYLYAAGARLILKSHRSRA
jgi:hypothetical protein